MKIEQLWKQEDSDFIKRKVIEHNMGNTSDEVKSPQGNVSSMLRVTSDRIVGGNRPPYSGAIDISISYGWMNFAEAIAMAELYWRKRKNRQKKGLPIDVFESFSFQAPDFYKKQGYEVFGILEDFPKGSRQYYLQKRWNT
ncbi:GNAT family N-acetyltransferase [Bacillus sp. AK031]